MAKGRYFSTSDISRICRVTAVTVGNWIRSGKLQASRLPTGYYRVAAEDLKEFLGRQAIKLVQPLDEQEPAVLIISDQASLSSQVTKVLADLRHTCRIDTAGDCLTAGAKISQIQPELLIVDLSTPALEGPDICRRIRRINPLRQVKILVLNPVGHPPGPGQEQKIGADLCLAKPVSSTDLHAVISKLIQ